MHARVKQDYRWSEVKAFGGCEYTKGDYRPVPAGFEAQAEAHPFLEVLAVAVEPEEAQPEQTPRPKRKSGGKS